MRQHLREIGQRRNDLDLQRVVVNRLHAQIGRPACARDDFGGVHHLHQFHVPGVFRRGCRIDQALPGVDEITRDDRIAVRPFRLGAQVEGVGGQIVREVVCSSATPGTRLPSPSSL